MLAQSFTPSPGRVLFRKDQAQEIAAAHGLKTLTEQAAFYNVSRYVYARVLKGEARPGEEFIGAVLTSEAARQYPDRVTFDGLFEAVAA